MINKEIENIILNLKDSFLYSEGIPGRMTKSCYYIAEHTKEDLNKLFEYIDQLENKAKQLGKGQYVLMQSRRKWKNKYYKERRIRKEAIEQLYLHYQDIGNMYFDLDEKVQNTTKQIQQAIDLAKTDKSIIGKTQAECLENVLKILKGEKEI